MNASKKLIVKNGNLREKREGTVYQLRFSMIENKNIILRVKNITFLVEIYTQLTGSRF
jgi:hypothetical protein